MDQPGKLDNAALRDEVIEMAQAIRTARKSLKTPRAGANDPEKCVGVQRNPVLHGQAAGRLLSMDDKHCEGRWWLGASL